VRLADLFSLARIALTPPLALAILAGHAAAAGVILVAALATDFLDGHFARRTGSSTELGRVLDPVADKVLAAGALGALLAAGRVPAELVIVIVLRDAALLAFGWLRTRAGLPVPTANAFGKVAFTALGVWLAGLVLGWSWPAWAPGFVAALYVAAGLSYAARLPLPFRGAAEGKR
jgi:CDP-diacylglycerol--glycerol-3-phosphate 3-phosphatidyltransferase